MALLNRVGHDTATTGTGTVTLGAAMTGHATVAEAGGVNATVYTYLIEEGDDFEIGRGTYTSAGTTFSRDTVILSKIGGTAGTSKMNLAGSATVKITAIKEDFATSYANHDFNGFNAIFDDNTGLTDDSGNELLWFQKTASAVNYLEVENASTTNFVIVRATGSDANVSLNFHAKGAGEFSFSNDSTGAMFDIETTGVTFLQDVTLNGADLVIAAASANGIVDGSANEQLMFTSTASAVNNFRITNAATGTNPTLSVEGSDTNVAMTLAGKGTGLLFGTTLSQTGVLNNELFACISADYTLTSSTVAQRAFDIATNGAVAVAASTLYQFMAQLWVTSMSGTSGNAGFDLVGSGTATLTSVMYAIYGGDGSADVGPLAASVSVSEASASLVPSLTAATGQRMIMTVIGAFRTNAAGTIIPSIDLQTAAAADVNANSFFRMWPVGTSSTESQGTWT